MNVLLAISTGAIVGIVVGAVLLILILAVIIWMISGYNRFVAKRNKGQEAFSTMDVYLKKRYDLIPNLVETVKGYAKHESQTLENVIAARNSAVSSKTAEERIKNDNILQGTLRSLFAVSEAYPELKANRNFEDLQRQLKALEEDIANARKYYNAVINDYNTVIEKFPGNILARMFGFTRKPLYEVSGAEQREAVKVQF